MTARVTSITLVLHEDMHEDDAAELAKACRQFRHVVDVILDASTPASDATARRERLRASSMLSELAKDLDR